MTRTALRMRRLPASHEDYGRICPDCAGPKAEQHQRCRPCWVENVLRDDGYWARRTCACGGPKARNARRCRPCANAAMVGKPRNAPVVVARNHIWRRKEHAGYEAFKAAA